MHQPLSSAVRFGRFQHDRLTAVFIARVPTRRSLIWHCQGCATFNIPLFARFTVLSNISVEKYQQTVLLHGTYRQNFPSCTLWSSMNGLISCLGPVRLGTHSGIDRLILKTSKSHERSEWADCPSISTYFRGQWDDGREGP